MAVQQSRGSLPPRTKQSTRPISQQKLMNQASMMLMMRKNQENKRRLIHREHSPEGIKFIPLKDPRFSSRKSVPEGVPSYPLIVEKDASPQLISNKKRSSFHFTRREPPRALNSLKYHPDQRKLSAPCLEDRRVIQSFPEPPEAQLRSGGVLTISKVKKSLKNDRSLLQRFQLCESVRSLLEETNRQRGSVLPEQLCNFHRDVFLLIMKYLKTKKLEGKLHEVLLAPWRKARGADLQFRHKQEILKRFFLGSREAKREVSPAPSPNRNKTVLLKKTPLQPGPRKVERDLWGDVEDSMINFRQDDSMTAAHRSGLYQFRGQATKKKQEKSPLRPQLLNGLRDFNRITNYHKNLIYFLMRTEGFPKSAFLEVLREVRLNIGNFSESCPYCVISQCSHYREEPPEIFRDTSALQNSLIVNKKPVGDKLAHHLNTSTDSCELIKTSTEDSGTTLYGWYQKMARNPDSLLYKHISQEQLQIFTKFEQETKTPPQPMPKPKLEPVIKTPVKPKKQQQIKRTPKKLTPEALYRKWLSKIGAANGLKPVFPDGPIPPYRFYIGRGNNSIIVKQALKSRWWWAPFHDAEGWETYNFIWTQWKSMRVLDTFSTHKSDQDHSPKSSSRLALTGLLHASSGSSLSTHNLSTVANTTGSSNFSKRQTKAVSPDKPIIVRSSHRICNRLQSNYHLANKKALFYNLREYYGAVGQDIFDTVPVTFHIRQGTKDKQYGKFVETYMKYRQKGKRGATHWIVKPGENTNRGFGIKICSDLQQVRQVVANTVILLSGKKRSYIVQRYITNPYLYKNRKFDIRCYVLVTSVNGNMRAYWYRQGYLRTSSREFSLKSGSKMVHLTNDAVQKRSDDYGKYESGNKLSYADFQKYIEGERASKHFLKEVLPQMRVRNL